MLDIKNASLKRMLLEHLIERMDMGDLDTLLQSGFSPELIDDLRQRPTRDFFFAAQNDGLRISVTIDTQQLTSCLWMRDRARRDEMLKEYFIANGASINLMRTMFTLPKNELSRLRTALDMAEKTTNGRPKLPHTSVRDLIHKTWHEINHNFHSQPERERLYKLHQKFPAYSIASLHRCTDEFNEVGTNTRTRVNVPRHSSAAE